jgi:hypothetical protein
VLTASVAAGEVVSATATLSNASFSAFTATSEFAANVLAENVASISGNVYEDVNGNGQIADDGIGLANAVVSIFLDNGNGVIDAGDVIVNSILADASGHYAFNGLGSGVYWVSVNSRSFVANAGLNAGYSIHDQWAEQTYGAAGSVNFDGSSYAYSTGAGALFGGMQANRSDGGAGLMSAEHVIRVSLAGSDRPLIDFGFSYNVITTTRDGDDVAPNNRTVQGSLRQFLQNSNALQGVQISNFEFAEALLAGAHTVTLTWTEVRT